MYVNLSKYYFDKCAKFADEQLESSKDLYKYRGEFRLNKIREDIIIGKLGEVAAYKFLKAKGININKPDFTIYERQNKSFAADLVTACGKQIHVKAQGFDSMMRYGASWLLQKSDSLVRKPSQDDYVLMTGIKGAEANILGVVSALDLYGADLFEDPKVSRYGFTKKAIYFDSIKRSGITLEAL